MAHYSFLLGFLLLIPVAAAALPPLSYSPAQSPSSNQSVTPPPPSSADDTQKNHLGKIIDALIGAGDFAGWVSLLSADPSSLPLTATLFIPNNDAIARFDQFPSSTANAFLIPYHVVPQRLTFADLRQLHVRARLPTMLPSKYIVITSNSPSNFSIDDSQITDPDIFVNPSFSVHGIGKVLDYAIYGDNADLVNPQRQNNKSPSHETASAPPKGQKQEFPADMATLTSAAAPSFRAQVFRLFRIVFALI